MKKQKRYPEVYVEMDFLERADVIEEMSQIDDESIRIKMDHPVFGEGTVEIFDIDSSDDTLALKSIYCPTMQDEEEMNIMADYYNNFLLEGEQTYLQYYHPEVGYYLLSRNVGVYGTNETKFK